MIKPFHFSQTGPVPAAFDPQLRSDLHAAGVTDHPTAEGVGFEIGVVLAVTLGIAWAVPLVLRVCGID